MEGELAAEGVEVVLEIPFGDCGHGVGGFGSRDDLALGKEFDAA